jgi:23S rRNA (cytidine1920-2'-O)/16S rRNA (cytidine1409-2'-O)-methyltransferase
VARKRCLDVGASTGGFTHVLLDAGAAHVTALDVGTGQLVSEIAQDPRVEERSGTSIRDVRPGDLGEPFDIVVADLSFISLRLVLGVIARLMSSTADAVLLVKPQFEVGRERLSRSGVVTSRAEQARVLSEVLEAARSAGLRARGLEPSPIRGATGNREYLLWVTRGPGEPLDERAVATAVDRAAKGAP